MNNTSASGNNQVKCSDLTSTIPGLGRSPREGNLTSTIPGLGRSPREGNGNSLQYSWVLLPLANTKVGSKNFDCELSYGYF